MVKRVAFTTLGCKLNFAETSGIARQFEENGYQRVEDDQAADVFVINTCTVTELANKKSRQAIRKIIKENPNAKVIAVGCYSQLKPEEVSEIEGVDLILGTENKFDILTELNKIEPNSKSNIITHPKLTETGFTPTYSFGDRTRSFLKVQDGCDYYCSYCAIPQARGKSRNNTIETTLGIAREIVNKGIREIILTGVNIGDFGKATNESFFDLLKALSAIEGLDRIRISSIEPNLLTNEIIEYVAGSRNILPHFHIPLQCGTDNLLRAMRRRYTTRLYADKVAFIKNLMPHACIAADIIVGVPGETNEEFENTVAFIKDIDISYLHVFTYSERENTLAVKMPNPVPVELRKERSKVLHALSTEKQLAFYEKHLNQTHKVLFEDQHTQKNMFGFTENYIRVQVPYNQDLINKITDTKLLSIAKNRNVQGQILM